LVLSGESSSCCFIVGASLAVGTKEQTLMLVWSLTGFFAGFIYPAWCAIYPDNEEINLR
jgi:hypothetical protein